MEIKHIIVQAGGRGSRLGHLTRNRPKALVPVENLPIIFHLFRKYPACKFIVIADYQHDVLERYLAVFADVEYEIVNAGGKQGTCGGLRGALEKVPPNEPVMVVWSDLILNQELDISPLPLGNYVGSAPGMECRWKYENGVFEEERSSSCGVAGMFLFEAASILEGVPEEGEFVAWLSRQNIPFEIFSLDHTREYGLLSEYGKLREQKCRPFNKIMVFDDCIVKEGVDEQGAQLAVRERAWYRKATDLGFAHIPRIFAEEPLKLERIRGMNVYEYPDMPLTQKEGTLRRIVQCLQSLHAYGSVPFDRESFEEAYLGKTLDRLNKIQSLVPFAKDRFITINGKKCRNVFFQTDRLKEKLSTIQPKEFVFLHGDCTFSNIMLRNGEEPVLIDPRGYFGRTEFYGDPAYDWAKLYYSIVGNYDQFNRKRFSLSIGSGDVQLEIQSSGWEPLEDEFFALLAGEADRMQIRLIHAIIWLSLTTYAWEDYDSICGAFYNGLRYLEELL